MTEVEWKTNEKQTGFISKPDKSEMFPPKKDPLLRSWKINSISGYYALVLCQSPWHPDVLHLKKNGVGGIWFTYSNGQDLQLRQWTKWLQTKDTVLAWWKDLATQCDKFQIRVLSNKQTKNEGNGAMNLTIFQSQIFLWLVFHYLTFKKCVPSKALSLIILFHILPLVTPYESSHGFSYYF